MQHCVISINKKCKSTVDQWKTLKTSTCNSFPQFLPQMWGGWRRGGGREGGSFGHYSIPFPFFSPRPFFSPFLHFSHLILVTRHSENLSSPSSGPKHCLLLFSQTFFMLHFECKTSAFYFPVECLTNIVASSKLEVSFVLSIGLSKLT